MRWSFAFVLVGSLLVAGSVRAEETVIEPVGSVRSEPDGRWDAPWDPGTIFLPPLGSLDLLVGRRAGERGEDWFGFLTLRFPLDHFVRTKSAEATPEPSAAPESVSRPEETRSDAPTQKAETAARPEATPSVSSATVVLEEHVSASIEGVPDGAESVEGAKPPRTWSRVALVGLARELGDALRSEAPERGSLDEIGSAASRARTSAWLPELRLRGAHGFDQTVAPPTSGVYGAPLTTRDGWDSAFEARLTFRLSRLVYDDGESSLLAMRQKLRTQIEARVEEGLALLASWIAAERKLRELDLEPEAALEEELVADRSALRLEVLTNGLFGVLVERHLGDRSLAKAPGRRGSEPAH